MKTYIILFPGGETAFYNHEPDINNFKPGAKLFMTARETTVEDMITWAAKDYDLVEVFKPVKDSHDS